MEVENINIIESLPGPSNVNIPSGVLCDLTNKSSHDTVTNQNIIQVETKLAKKHHKYKKQTPKEKLLYSKCRNTLQKLVRLRKTIKKIKRDTYLKVISENDLVNDLIQNKMTSSAAVLLKSQLKIFKVKPKGRRWTVDEKILSLRLYKRSPMSYRLLRRLFCLPTQATLKSVLRRLPLGVGINDKVFEVLRKNISPGHTENSECVLMWDEMSIRKHLSYDIKQDCVIGFQDHGLQGKSSEIASHALVFMVCGVRKKVKQPVAFYFSGDHVTADRLVALIKEVLKHCFNAGIKILATICDQDGVNRRAISLFGASIENPYFRFNNEEIVALYDTPHLLKSFRNLFLKYDIKCQLDIADHKQEGIAKWSHIKDFYKVDNMKNNFVFAPGLTKTHLDPNTKQKMKVRLAAQTLSHSVASGMFAKISAGVLPMEALATATIISDMDKLFDCVNADSPDLKNGKPFLTNLTNTSPHMNHFKKMKKFFTYAKLQGAKCRPPSIDGWIHTINGIEKIWTILKKKYPEIKGLSTRRLQQDALENCFGCIRANCGSNTNPTAVQFMSAFKTSILSNLSSINANMNCQTDDAEIIDNYKSLIEWNQPTIRIENQQQQLHPDTAGSQDVEESLDASYNLQACAYVCGFIAKKIVNNCHTCKSMLITERRDIVHSFIEFKEYNQLKESLYYVKNNFIICVEQCADKINEFLELESHSKNIRKIISEKLKQEIKFNFLHSCEEHFSNNMLRIITDVFHICINRYIILKNRSFSEQAAAKVLQKKINILKHI